MNNNTFIHKYLETLITKNDVVVDMTMGNGNDTYFLATKTKHVYSFDINDEALINTKERCESLNNITLIKDNHINVDNYIKDKVKLFIFNLGYLPYSKETTITKASDTLIAFKKAYNLLIDNGYIIITFYLGQSGGYDEYYSLDKYINDNNLCVIDSYQKHQSIDEPITYIIKKY